MRKPAESNEGLPVPIDYALGNRPLGLTEAHVDGHAARPGVEELAERNRARAAAGLPARVAGDRKSVASAPIAATRSRPAGSGPVPRRRFPARQHSTRLASAQRPGSALARC